MTGPTLPTRLTDEKARLQALRELEILDTPPESELDDLVQLAAEVCCTPISTVTMVDEQRQWFKASVGQQTKESPRDFSFCSHAIEGRDLFVVEDATLDVRFANNPLVTGGQQIRFYAGLPLETVSGYAVGTLCVIDTVPRTLKPSQERALRVLANQVKVWMDLRSQRRTLKIALEEKERIARGLHESESLFRLFMNRSPFASYIKDGDGRMLYYNELLAERFGVDQQRWLGRTDAEIWPEELASQFRKNDLTVLFGGKSLEVVEHTKGLDGTDVCWKSFKYPYRDSSGRLLLAGISVDITDEVQREAELERANALLQQLATSDALTGLKNRRAFEERLQLEFAMTNRTGRELSVLMIDVDDFKRRNDQWGHAAGDVVLRNLGLILKQTLRLTDLAARYGGEEFAILLPETDTVQAAGLAERLKRRIAAEAWDEEPVTVSFGVATKDADMLQCEQLVKAADDALYAAKRAGKDQIFMSSDLREECLVGHIAS